MAGVIRFNKALTLFKKKFGKDYCPYDLYEDFLLSHEIDLFIAIDASICEIQQNGFSEDGFFVRRVYPYSGYVRIPVDNQVKSLFAEYLKSISINEITGLYNQKQVIPYDLKACLFNKNLDYNHYNSLQSLEFLQLNLEEEQKQLKIDITFDNIFFSQKQLLRLGLNFNAQSEKNLITNNHISNKEEKSIGLIIAAFAELAKIDISVPHSKNHKENLLPLIDRLDPEGKTMDPKTLAKYLKFAITHSDIRTKKSAE